MAALLDLKRAWPSVLNGVSEPVQRTDTGVTSPRKDEFACHSHADHLVIDKVGRHSIKCQIALSLPDDLVPRRLRNSLCKTLTSNLPSLTHQYPHSFP